MQKRENKVDFSLSFLTVEEEKRYTGQFLVGLLLYLGLSGCLWSVLGLAGSGADPFLLLGVGFVYYGVSCGLPQKWRLVYFIAVIGLAVYAVAASRFIIEGWNVTLNQIFVTMESYFGRIFFRYQVNGTLNQPLCASLFLLLPTTILGVLCGRTAAKRGAWRYAMLVAAVALWAVALAFRAAAPIFYVAALVVAAAVLTGHWLMLGNRIPDSGKMTLWLLVLTVGLTLVAALPSLVLGKTGETGADDARQAATQTIHALRYDREQQTLPEGNFKKIGDLVPKEDTALYVTVEKPGEYYLRSFVGEIYTGEGWAALTAKKKAEYATLFSWLHERGFYGQNQYALLTEALGATGPTRELLIKNVGASTAYLYAPYETIESEPDKARIGDENLLARGLRGESEYTLSVSNSFISDYEQTYDELTAARGRNDPGAIEYLTSENAYRDFVYTNYLEMPQESREAIEKFLDGLELPEGKISFSNAQMIVNAYLSSISYQDAPESSYMDSDFLTYFLEDSQEGNSIHFATAATLMFRYLGVPARYVEGYRLTQEKTDAAGAGGTVSVSGTDAYAWAEIYQDGIGFVPFNFKPSNTENSDQPNQNQEDLEPLQEEPPAQPSLQELLTWPRVAFLISLLLISLLLSFLFMVVRRAVKQRHLRKLLGVADNGEAVSLMTTYLMSLLWHMDLPWENGSLYLLRAKLEKKLGQELGEAYAAVISVQQAALFSGRPVTDGDRAQVRTFLDEIVGQLRERSSSTRRFRLRWVECIL